MVHLPTTLERCSRTTLVLAGLAMVAVIGAIDNLTGFEVLFSVFYLLDVGLAAWFVGRGFGLLMSVLSAIVSIGGDMMARARYSHPWVPVWNAIILMVSYFIVVWLLTSLRSLHRGLGLRIMAHRASMIGGSFSAEPAPTGGTIVTCSIPKASRPAKHANSSDAAT
jgi:hypothetical protein